MAFFSRGKNKIKEPYVFKDMYEEYIADKKEDSIYYVTYNEYVDICSRFYKAISNALIEQGIRFTLPYALGYINVVKQKTIINKSLPVDWQTSITEHKRIYILNEHTGGHTYKFYWSKPYRVVNKYTYRLILTRGNKRHLARVIKQKKIDFFGI